MGFLLVLLWIVPYLILVDCEEDESVGIEGLNLHGDGQVARVVVPDVPLHRVSGTVEGVARVFDDLMVIKFLQFCWFWYCHDFLNLLFLNATNSKVCCC